MKSLAVTLGVVLLVFGLVSGANAQFTDHLDIMGELFLTFRTSVEDQYSDMTHFLLLLRQMNEINDALSGYLQGLAGNTDALSAAIAEASRAAEANSALRYYAISLADNPQLGLFDIGGVNTQDLRDLRDLYASVPGSNFLPNANPVPEPATMLLLASGLVGLAGLRKKFTRS